MYVISLYLFLDIHFAVEKCIEIGSESEIQFPEVKRMELCLLFRLSHDVHNLSSFGTTRSQNGAPTNFT